MRSQWVEKRWSDPIRTQMHYARKGVITEEMEFIARRERLIAANWFATKWRAAA